MIQGTARFKEKRESILDGAARLFNQHGIKGGTLADVARSVGLVTNSLTYYYRKKEDLASACLLRAMDAMGDCADQAAATGTLADGVTDYLRRYVTLLADIAEGRHAELIVFSDLLSLGPPHDAQLHEAYTAMFRRVRRLLRAPDAPLLSRDALNARTHLLLSLASWGRAWLSRHEPADYPYVGERMADLLLRGVAAPERVPAPAPATLPTLVDGRPVGQDRADSGDDIDRATGYLCAATRLVNRHGYQGASVDRIATELGLTKGSFYHHHETKEELITACFERTFEAMRRAQDTARQADGSGLDRLGLACRALLRHQMSPEGPLLRITAWNGLPDALRRDTQRTMGRLGDRFGTFIVDGMADGTIRVIDPSIAAQLINGMINAAAELERWVPGVNADNVFDLFARPLFTGLATA